MTSPVIASKMMGVCKQFTLSPLSKISAGGMVLGGCFAIRMSRTDLGPSVVD